MHGFDIFSQMFKEETPDLVFTDDDPFPLFTPQENIIDPFSLSSFFSFSPSCTNFSALDASDSQMHSYLQRSSSCKLFDRKPGFRSCDEVVHSDTLMDSPSFQWENDFFRGQIRRVFSAGDLKKMHATETCSERDEAKLKVGRYSAQERKEKISKYRAKRSQRKFNKTIKYACRKTLADNRVRIRGRFARNQDTSVVAKAPCSSSNTQQDQDEFWVNKSSLIY
ncbi:hypothetical protein PIB30_000674 [Stylosanthes scabra]|uniref:CCT domain-containing protein n=1 Tax=Stylosanthes scabra TaxID=79078 RepID=A0ABU6XZB8_9FABA|nr:hypothetical protein [Stylosanthes scabra]